MVKNNSLIVEIVIISILLFVGCKSFSQENQLLGEWQLIQVGTELNPISEPKLNQNLNRIQTKVIEFKKNGKMIDFSQETEVDYTFNDSTLSIGSRNYVILNLNDQILFIQDIPSKSKLLYSQYVYQKLE